MNEAIILKQDDQVKLEVEDEVQVEVEVTNRTRRQSDAIIENATILGTFKFNFRFSNDSDNVKLKKFLKVRAKCIEVRRYVRCILTRILFIFVIAFNNHFLSCIRENNKFYLFGFCSLIIAIDGMYIFLRRRGREFFWFSTSIAAYSLAATVIIILQVDFKYKRNDIYCRTNQTNMAFYPNCYKLDVTVCSIIEVLVVLFLVSLVYAKILMPNSKRMSKEVINKQLAMLVSAAADIVDIADHMQNELLANHYYLTKLIQVAFSLSIIQFSLSIGATKKRSKDPKLNDGLWKLFDIVFSTEAWSLIIVIILQEIPCLIVRICFIFEFSGSKIRYSLYFFVIKNFLMVILYTYRGIFIINSEYLTK